MVIALHEAVWQSQVVGPSESHLSDQIIFRRSLRIGDITV
jgi:hypothetical protein